MVQRVKGNGPYAPLGVGYFRDDAIIEAGPEAELLFVRGLAFCAESMSDGYITDLQLTHHVGAGLRPSSVRKRAETLVKVGLWSRVSGGYLVKSWLKWNIPASEIGRRLKTDRERKASNDGGSSPSPVPGAEDIPSGIRSESDPQGRAGYDTAPHDTSLEVSAEGEPHVSSGHQPSPRHPKHCQKHESWDHDQPCRNCGYDHADDDARHVEDELSAKRAKQTRAAQTAACPLCDHNGLTLTDRPVRCAHPQEATA